MKGQADDPCLQVRSGAQANGWAEGEGRLRRPTRRWPRNRKATHDYFIGTATRRGWSLTTEVKALRMGRASLTEAWIEIDRHGGGLAPGAHIPEYLQGTWNNHSPRRKPKLLLPPQRAGTPRDQGQAKGYTGGPAGLYFIGGAPSWRSPGSGVAGLGQASGAA